MVVMLIMGRGTKRPLRRLLLAGGLACLVRAPERASEGFDPSKPK